MPLSYLNGVHISVLCAIVHRRTQENVMSVNQVRTGYDGPISDSDTHVHERDFEFFKEYLPRELHGQWLLQRRDGPEGFGLYLGERKVHNAEANSQGLVPPPGRLKEWLKAMKEGKSNVEGWIDPT